MSHAALDVKIPAAAAETKQGIHDDPCLSLNLSFFRQGRWNGREREGGRALKPFNYSGGGGISAIKQRGRKGREGKATI